MSTIPPNPQIMQTSTQMHKKKYRCASQIMPSSEPEPESRAPIQKLSIRTPKSTRPEVSKSLTPIASRSSDSVLKSPATLESRSSSSTLVKSMNSISKPSSDSLITLFKLPLILISKLLSPLSPLSTKRNASSVVAPSLHFNMPMTFSTIHSSKPCNTVPPVPCNTQPDTTINNPCDHLPCNNINSPPNPCNVEPDFTNSLPYPCNPHQKESDNSKIVFIRDWLCIILMKNNTDLCDTTKPPVTSTVQPPDVTTTESAPNGTETTTTQTDGTSTTTTQIPTSSTSTTSKEEPVTPTSTTSKEEPVSSTTTKPGCTPDEPTPPCIPINNCKIHKHHKPHLPLIHLPKPTPCKPHIPFAPIISPHPLEPFKFYPPHHGFHETLKPLFKPVVINKPNDLNSESQELLIKLLKILTSSSTSSTSTNT